MAIKLLLVLAVTGLVLAVFAAGLGLGFFYNEEIAWLYGSYVVKSYSDQALFSPSPTYFETESALLLPGLDEPLPLVFSDTLEESAVQRYLKEGAVVLPLGTELGQPGNVVITAHSSGVELFGPYRFAFARLSELMDGAEYVISTPKARYHYRVYDREVVWPQEVDRLPGDERSTVTLVTCWPLGTDFKRLLVHAELIRVDYLVNE